MSRGVDLGLLFQNAVQAEPNRTAILTRDLALSYREADRMAAAVAGALEEIGVDARHRVAVISRNRAEMVVIWLACLRLGACFCPLNGGFNDRQMGRLFQSLRPKVVLAESDLVPVVDMSLQFASLRPQRVVLGAEVIADWRLWSELESHPPTMRVATVDDSEWAAVLCTSGTTGTSKAVALSHRWFTKLCETSALHWGFTGTDTFYCPLPLYHMDALAMTVAPAIFHATTAALGERFSVSRFWDEIREFEATVFDFLGTTLTLLWKAPPRIDDADNPARLGWGVPMPEFAPDFERRFGCLLTDCYGSTDIGIPVYGKPGEAKPNGSCGRVIDSYQVAILAPDGTRLTPGEVGEIAVRPTEPHTIMECYVGEPEATIETWRGLWHHTGDLGRIDDQGYLFFEGRTEDFIRRRGENVSVFELEEMVLSHPDVDEAAAIGVPAALMEEDIKVVAVPRSGTQLNAEGLAAWLGGALPRFMTVRYVEICPVLPKTATHKVIKGHLRSTWRTPQTWDIELARYMELLAVDPNEDQSSAK
jgi:carnitine-CoA ligase